MYTSASKKTRHHYEDELIAPFEKTYFEDFYS